jgi:predicted TIM-barrel fold metal-dependent hydrolase
MSQDTSAVGTIDADGHLTEPAAVWAEYAEARYRDQVIRVEADGLWVEDRFYGLNPAPTCYPGAFSDPATPVTWADLLPGGYDPAARLGVLDEEGFERAIFFPSLYLLSGDIEDPAVAAANARAYNSWVADFCGQDRRRLFAFGVAPLQDVDAAVREIERVAALGLPGVTIRPERYHGLAVDDPRCEPFWAAAQDADLTVVFHGSFGNRMPGFAASRHYTNMFFSHMVCHPFEQMAAMLDTICGGVLERFPRLRVGFFEAGLGWLPYWLERMDEHFDEMRHLVPALARRPTEYFREQCFVTWEPEETVALRQLVDLGLERCVLWGSDYPHFDCVYPGARAEADHGLAGFDERVRAAILHDNPVRFARLPA